MENIELNIKPRYVKNMQEFFSFPDIKKFVEENNFDSLFAEYDDYKVGKCQWSDLIKVFDYLQIDWIKHASYIPRYAYTHRNIENLELPKNIIKVAGPIIYSYSDKPIMNITYDGTLEDFRKIDGWELLREALKAGGKIICSDGVIEKIR